jgi:hypothetical protein
LYGVAIDLPAPPMIVVRCLLATIRFALPSWAIEAFSSLRPN